MSTAIDYAGRLADLFAFRGIFPSRIGTSQLLAQQLARPGDSGMMIAGIEKLAQRVLVTLLTKLGSKLHDVTAGTSFITDAQRGLWRTPADVSQSFYSARLDLRRQIQAVETANDPDDERWGSLELAGVTVSNGNVTLRLALSSLAGTEYTFLTPIAVAPHQ